MQERYKFKYIRVGWLWWKFFIFTSVAIITFIAIPSRYTAEPVVRITILGLVVVIALILDKIAPRATGYADFFQDYVIIKLSGRTHTVRYNDIVKIRKSKSNLRGLPKWYKWTLKLRNKSKIAIRGDPVDHTMDEFFNKLTAKMELAKDFEICSTQRKSNAIHQQKKFEFTYLAGTKFSNLMTSLTVASITGLILFFFSFLRVFSQIDVLIRGIGAFTVALIFFLVLEKWAYQYEQSGEKGNAVLYKDHVEINLPNEKFAATYEQNTNIRKDTKKAPGFTIWKIEANRARDIQMRGASKHKNLHSFMEELKLRL